MKNVLANKNWRVGLLSFLLVSFVVTLFATIPALREITDQTEQMSLDFRYRHFNRQNKPNKNIVVIDIDEETINRYAESFGRWPWPRYVHSELIKYIADGKPSMILFDILFTEPQKNSDGDEALAAASQEYGTISHGALFLSETGLEETQIVPLPKDRPFPTSPQWQNAPSRWFTDGLFRDVALPNQKIWAKTPYLHNVGVEPDRDGVLRRVPLLTHYDQIWIPSLSLQGLLSQLKEQSPKLRLNNSYLEIQTDMRAPYRRIPMDEKGQLPLHFYSSFYDIDTLRASHVIEPIRHRDEGLLNPDDLSPDYFKDKVVIIGTSAMGLNDLKVTPLGKQIPGVFLHATAISNILDNDFLHEPPSLTAPLLAILLVFLCYLAIFFSEHFYIRNFVPISLLLATFGFSIYFFRFYSFHVPMALPLIAALASLLHGYAYTAIVETKRRKMIEGTLSKYLSPAITKQLIESGINPTAEVGNWREISILFSDIRSFTSLSEVTAPDFLVKVLNSYLANMTDIIFDHEGTLDKFIGDAVMAFWGAPIEDSAHARKAVQSALKMIEAVDEFNRIHQQDRYPQLKIGIGVHTGKAIVGNIGSNKRLDYTIIGDNVNLASRLEGLTKEYNIPILISGSTYEMIKDEFLCRPIDVVVAKGKKQAAPLYQPLCSINQAATKPQLQQLAQQFSEAFKYYQQGLFSEAIEQFRKTLEFYPEDGPSHTYIERCERLIAEPPTDWQGIYIAKSK